MKATSRFLAIFVMSLLSVNVFAQAAASASEPQTGATGAFTVSQINEPQAAIDLTIVSTNGCTIRANVLAGTRFSLQTADKPELALIASLSSDGSVSLKRVVARAGPNAGSSMVSIREAQGAEAQKAFEASGVRSVATVIAGSTSSGLDNQKGLGWYEELPKCANKCCTVACANSDGGSSVFRFCGCGCVECESNSCCNGLQ